MKRLVLHDLLMREAALLEEQAGLRREIAKHFAHATPAPEEYGSRPPYQPPPDRSHSWLRLHAKTIPGAKRRGGVRGRSVYWVVSSTDYFAWLASLSAVNVPKVDAAEDEDAAIDRAFEKAGVRPSRLRVVSPSKKGAA